MKAAITAILALGVGLAVPASSNAAAAPPAGLGAALAASDGIQLAQGPAFVRRPGPMVRAPARGFVPRQGMVRQQGVVRQQGFVGRPGFAGRPGFVGRPAGFVGRPGFAGRGGFVYGYRPWYRRPYFGTIIGGVALGTILTVAAIGVAPAYAPAPNTCWYWADPSQTTGYWDYCE